jgi:hypothetical protein
LHHISCLFEVPGRGIRRRGREEFGGVTELADWLPAELAAFIGKGT